MALHVALVYNLRRSPAAEDDLEAEYDPPGTIEAIAEALGSAGHRVARVEADLQCGERLRELRPDIVFNIAEGLRGSSREAHVPAICEMLGLPCTGSGVLTQALCQDKAFTLRVLRAAGIPTARFWEVPPGAPPPAEAVPPLFVKPAREGSSMGVTEASLCRDRAELLAQVERVHRRFGEPALVETFLPGREFTVGLVGNEPRVLPIREINFAEVPSGYPPIYSYRFKKEWDEPRFFACPAPIDGRLRRRLAALAVGAFRALGCVDVCRVDLRCDAAGRPAVLEVNPLPGLTPDYSDLPCMAAAGGMSFRELVLEVLAAACRRYGLPA